MRSPRPIHHHRLFTAAIGSVLAFALTLVGPVPAAHAAGGARLWTARYDIHDDYALAVATSPDGSRVFVTGSGGSSEYVTVAYDSATGARIWVGRYQGPGDGANFAYAIAVSPDGARVYVTGGSEGANGDSDYATLAYDAATGARIWLRRFDGSQGDYDAASAIAVTPDGGTVYVTGESSAPSDYATLAYDAASGARIWVRRYNGPWGDFDIPHALAVSPDGSRVYVTGTSHGLRPVDSEEAYDFATLAYEASTGRTVWLRRYDTPWHGYDSAAALAVSPDGTRLVVTGGSEGDGFGSDYATVTYGSTTGDEIWVRRYHGPADGGGASAIAASPDGAVVYVTGSDGGTGSGYDYATLAYDAAGGTRIWARRYDGPSSGADHAAALAVSPDGSTVYVTGRSEGPQTGYDYATVAYATLTGARTWVGRYNGPTNDLDQATALAVSPDGTRVYVTGESWLSGETATDYLTIAYRAA